MIERSSSSPASPPSTFFSHILLLFLLFLRSISFFFFFSVFKFFFNFYCYSITVVCLFSPSLHPTPAEPTSLLHLHPPPWFVHVSFIVVPVIPSSISYSSDKQLILLFLAFILLLYFQVKTDFV